MVMEWKLYINQCGLLELYVLVTIEIRNKFRLRQPSLLIFHFALDRD